MNEYTGKYGHEINAVPGSVAFDAENDIDAMAQANIFVEAGYRGGTWINISLNDGAYHCHNEHGKAVGNRTYY